MNGNMQKEKDKQKKILEDIGVDVSAYDVTASEGDFTGDEGKDGKETLRKLQVKK